ncbi:MAG: putative LPS assembly protein LptD, partial [Candidatus Marinimicrobia bacterium]|nr:putative LPS assembly protein LptD [Candidatus Neomarinimicrobiota bacterium]
MFSYFIIILILPLSLFADEKLRLIRADILENDIVNGQSIQYLYGNVIFEKGAMVINCDKAFNIEKTGQSSMLGEVKVVDENRSLVCDSLHFDSPNNILYGFGNSRIWDEDYELKSDTITYYSDLDSGITHGNSVLKQNNQIITSHTVYYAKQVDQDAASYIAEGNVSISEEGRTATCGKAIYKQKEQSTSLTINPQIIEEKQTISGSEIVLQYNEDILQNIYIPSKANVKNHVQAIKKQNIPTTNSDNKLRLDFINDLSGNSLNGFFYNGKLDSLQVEGMATTQYHIIEDSIYQGENIASGDTIIMQFFNSDIDKIIISGGSRGEYKPDTTASNIEGPILYSSEIIKYNVNQEETDLHGDAKIDYTNMNLDAGYININWVTNILEAKAQSNLDSTFSILKPTIIEEGRDPMVGNEMVYNLSTKKGSVLKGRTSAEDGFYTGSQIRNQDKKTIFIDNSTYTTCDLENPHFHFASNKMKMINDDKVIAKPITFYINNIPIIGLPFGVFPHKGGRRQSGWIMPGYGESSYRGQFIDGLGYYWAPNEFWDSKLTTSLADRQGLTIRLTNNYRKRYAFSGGAHFETKQYFSSSISAQDRVLLKLSDNVKSDYVFRWN